VGSYWREAYNITNYDEKVVMDRSYSEEWGWIHCKTSIGLESTGSQKETKTKQTWKRTVL